MFCSQIFVLIILPIRISVIKSDLWHGKHNLTVIQLTMSQEGLQEIKHHWKWHPIETQSRHYIQQHCWMMVRDIHLLKALHNPQTYKWPRQPNLSSGYGSWSHQHILGKTKIPSTFVTTRGSMSTSRITTRKN